MIEYNNRKEEGTITCDTCGECAYFEGSFQDCIDEAKSDGWRIYMDECNEWMHECPVCNI
ncbi:MAG: hypothetical protein WC783_00005 [Candidatus Paceibacterota bacterium]|jgi:hypothetical protein